MLRHFKVPSTPADPSEAIEAGLRTLLDTLRSHPAEISFSAMAPRSPPT